MGEVSGITVQIGNLATVVGIAVGFTAIVVALAIFMWQVRSQGNAQLVELREQNATLREQNAALKDENERQRAERERQRDEDRTERERQRDEDRTERERFWSELQRQNGRLSDAEREQARHEGANQTLNAILREQSHTHEAAD